MTVVTKTIGRLPVNLGDYDNTKSYGRKNRVFLYGCEFESLMENNTHAPMTWDGAETFTEDTVHWKRVSGSPEAWIAGQDKPAASEEYPYNGMGRVVLKKNMVGGVNTLTQAAFEDSEGNDRGNTIYVIQYDFTLGEDITVPANCVLEFDGGSINGAYTITGNNTGIKSIPIKIFGANIIIDGSWNIKEIFDDWFDGNGNHTIDNVFALSDATINNTIYLNKLVYNFDCVERRKFIVLKSNTHVICKSTINVSANSRTNYEVIHISGVINVIFEGGHLIGDVETHTGTTGEWGMGVNILSSSNIIIKDIICDDMWGDGFYIGVINDNNPVHNTNIYFQNVLARYNRRQGLSVIDGEIRIDDSTFTDTGTKKQTAPGSNMDIEPNTALETVNIKINNCNFINTDGSNGMLISLASDPNTIVTDIRDSRIGNVSISSPSKHCYFYNCYINLFNIVLAHNANTNIYLIDCDVYNVYQRYEGEEEKQLANIINCRLRTQGPTNDMSGVHIEGGVLKESGAIYYDDTRNPCIIKGSGYTPKYFTGEQWYRTVKTVIDNTANLEEGQAVEVTLPENHYMVKVLVHDYSSRISCEKLMTVSRGKSAQVVYTKFYPVGTDSYRNQLNCIIDASLLTNTVLIGCPYRISNGMAFRIGKISGAASFYYKVEILGFNSDNPACSATVETESSPNTNLAQYFGIEGNVKITDISNPPIPIEDREGNAYYNSSLEHIILGAVRKRGTTTQRPANVDVGFDYFDTTLGKPIYWNGVKWVKADGTDADA